MRPVETKPTGVETHMLYFFIGYTVEGKSESAKDDLRPPSKLKVSGNSIRWWPFKEFILRKVIGKK